MCEIWAFRKNYPFDVVCVTVPCFELGGRLVASGVVERLISGSIFVNSVVAS